MVAKKAVLMSALSPPSPSPSRQSPRSSRLTFSGRHIHHPSSRSSCTRNSEYHAWVSLVEDRSSGLRMKAWTWPR